MKTIILHIVLLFTLVFSNVYSQGIQLNIGSDTLSSNYPFTTYWMDGRTDMLYLASELVAAGGSPGYFTGIAFYVNHPDTLTMNGFNIKLQNTIDTVISSFSEPWQVCYSGSHQVLDTGWTTIYFIQSFGWNGNDNIKIEICYNNNRYTWFSTVRSTVNPNKTYGKYTDLSSGDGCIDITTGAVQSRRPNIRLLFMPVSGVSNISLAPEKYSLSQNYPNPFNPETRISYSIPKAGMVTLKVFDVLGRQVSELVNEYKTPGNYIVEFNASNLSSGTYFYKLVSGEYTDIKKMTVVK